MRVAAASTCSAMLTMSCRAITSCVAGIVSRGMPPMSHATTTIAHVIHAIAHNVPQPLTHAASRKQPYCMHPMLDVLHTNIKAASRRQHTTVSPESQIATAELPAKQPQQTKQPKMPVARRSGPERGGLASESASATASSAATLASSLPRQRPRQQLRTNT
jgi:hypothetical protein